MYGGYQRRTQANTNPERREPRPGRYEKLDHRGEKVERVTTPNATAELHFSWRKGRFIMFVQDGRMSMHLQDVARSGVIHQLRRSLLPSAAVLADAFPEMVS